MSLTYSKLGLAAISFWSRSSLVIVGDHMRLGIKRFRVRSAGGAKKWMHVCKYLPLWSCVLCYIMCLIVVSVCTIVNLRHWVSLAPLFGSVYITVLNCICYAMFIWWFLFYYMHCPAWQILCNPAFNTNITAVYRHRKRSGWGEG